MPVIDLFKYDHGLSVVNTDGNVCEANFTAAKEPCCEVMAVNTKFRGSLEWTLQKSLDSEWWL